MGRHSVTMFFLFFVFSGSLAAGQVLRAVHVDEGPRLDGSLADEVWKMAVPFTEFKMVEPSPDSTPTEKTELRILYDKDNLYLGVMCYDRDVSRISANSMVHDGGGDYGHAGQPGFKADAPFLKIPHHTPGRIQAKG